VEENPRRADIIRRHYHRPVLNQAPRSFLARTQKRFDVIQVENWGSSIPGAAALAQNYDFTVEAFTEYLDHLTENGVLIITRRLLLPPANTIRLWASAMEALKKRHPDHPGPRLAIVRNWGVFTLLVSPRPLTNSAKIRDFAREMNFDLVYLDGSGEADANRFNTFDRPHHFTAIHRLARSYESGAQETYFKNHPLDVAPQRDHRPFPDRFLKWTGLTTIYKSKGERLYSLLLSGEIVVSVLFAQALCVVLFLLGAPLLIIRKKERRPTPPQFLYFAGVGAGFMFVEIYFIDALILLFGDPLISVTAALVGILIFSGAGGRWSRNMEFPALKTAMVILLALLALLFLTLHRTLPHLLALPLAPRWIIDFLLLAPPGFLLGLPFPMGMRHLPMRPAQRAFAWTTNGCASVLASIGSAQIAISLGLPALMAFAVVAYAVALAAISRN
ncbi:MAG: hypothetical protein GY859_24875, partial [Desulfobacterales bacterium]|nr:hypothetical protein [Desulfobacterales bacterium]